MSTTLRLNSTGPEVLELQQALKKANFSPGKIDGQYGKGTEAAVLAFQRSKKLAADGVVGPGTAKALGLSFSADAPSVIPLVTAHAVSQLFPATPLKNINSNLPLVLDALTEVGLTDRQIVLMALGTIRAETEGFLPISEYQSVYNSSPDGDHPFDLYDYREDLGNQGPPDGASYRGRGFVQLTGRDNYTQYTRELDVDLVDKPDLANDPVIAAKILARFLKDSEKKIREALADGDLKAARRAVNGGVNGLDRFSDTYNRGLKLIPDPDQAQMV